MKRKLILLPLLLLFVSLTACNNDPEEPNENNNPTTQDPVIDNDEDIEGVTSGGKYGTDDPNATSFSFNAGKLAVPETDLEYLNIGTYGTNNFFEMGGDIRIRTNTENNKVIAIEIEKNTLGYINFTVTKPSFVSFSVSSTSSENTSKVVLINQNKERQILSSEYQKVTLLNENTEANVLGTKFCKITSFVQPGTYTLRSPIVSDKEDPAYRKNLKLSTITVGEENTDSEGILLSADTLKSGSFGKNIKLFEGDWGSINATATTDRPIVIENNNKEYEQYTFGTRIKTGGKMEGEGTNSSRAIIINIKEKTEITMFAMSSSKDSPRIVYVYNENQTSVVHTIKNIVGTSLYPYSFTLEAGTYYLTTSTSGLNIYGFLINQIK